MFGYATDETEECMPLTIVLAHKLNSKMAELRRTGVIPWLRPDSKTQVRISFQLPKQEPLRSLSVNWPIVSTLDVFQEIILVQARKIGSTVAEIKLSVLK